LPTATLYSSFSERDFHLRRCSSCEFIFVADPRLDFSTLYNQDYYAGRGADPNVNYVDEWEHADETVRRYEWRGICRVVSGLTPALRNPKWLDYGCGTGGLVAYARLQGWDRVVGYEEGGSAYRLREARIIDDGTLEVEAGTYDLVTAIEVIEHAVDPVSVLAHIRRLLRPGGLLFLTTGNAAPYAHRVAEWRYVLPDVHVSYFQPTNLALALSRAGFEPDFPGYRPGWDDIIRFKVLKALRQRKSSPVTSFLPWPLIARLVDRRLGLSAQPVGWARPRDGADR
jgi:SAM-dependent methyltransferase